MERGAQQSLLTSVQCSARQTSSSCGGGESGGGERGGGYEGGGYDGDADGSVSMCSAGNGSSSDEGGGGNDGEGGGGNAGGGMDGTDGNGGSGGNGGASGIVQVVRLRSTTWPAPSSGNACSLPKRDLDTTKTTALQAKGMKTRQPIAKWGCPTKQPMAGVRKLDCRLAHSRRRTARVAVPLLLVVAASPSESNS